MQFTRPDADTLEHILRWRRDVRHFSSDAVAEDVVDRLRAAMDLAPSVGNARPWRVVRVSSADVRARVRENFAVCNARAASGYDGAQQAAYRDLKLAGLDKAPVQLAVFTVADPTAGHGLGRQTLPETLCQSTAMAIHTLWLVARAENLGMGLVSILDARAVKTVLAVPEDWRFAAYVCIGHPEFTDDTPLLHRADWQKNEVCRWEER